MNSEIHANDPLIDELRFYAANKLTWLRVHPNEFVVIAGNRVEGFHPDYESAFKAGLKAFGLDRLFLIKQVRKAEPSHFVY